MRVTMIAGDERRFTDDLPIFREYFEKLPDVSVVSSVPSKYLDHNDLKTILERHVLVHSEPNLLIYSGHGGFGYWDYDPERGRWFDYTMLVNVLRRSISPVYILNDTCYGASLIHYLEKYKWNQPVGLMAAGNKECSGFGNDVIRSWGESKVFDPKDYPYYVVDLTMASFETKTIKVDGRLKVVIPKLESTPAEIAAEDIQHYHDRIRWGFQFDHLFFPKR